jgi:glutamate 5-kinase
MPSTPLRNRIAGELGSLVIKVGTNAICDRDGRIDKKVFSGLAGQIAKLIHAGKSVCLVASGAVGAGMAELDLARRPRTLPMLQATAAVGQGQLMRRFHDRFARGGVQVAQVLVTREDFEDRRRYLNIRNTLSALAEKRILPIINENDAVAVDEFRFGDNDIISALVCNMLGYDLLVLLTTVDGVLGRDGRVVDLIESAAEARSLVTEDRSRLGSGGMGSKLQAAGMVTRAGELAVIANARTPNILTKLTSGKKVGTVIVPAKRRMSSRRRWIAQASRPAGALVVDEGARAALTARGKSLLPSGITEVRGDFEQGDIVRIVAATGEEIARGLTNYPAAQVRRIQGRKTAQIQRVLGEKPYDEVVHRDNMTLA